MCQTRTRACQNNSRVLGSVVPIKSLTRLFNVEKASGQLRMMRQSKGSKKHTKRVLLPTLFHSSCRPLSHRLVRKTWKHSQARHDVRRHVCVWEQVVRALRAAAKAAAAATRVFGCVLVGGFL